MLHAYDLVCYGEAGACHVQVDILSNDGEVQEVVKFVSDNAQRLLNVDSARVMPISSRMALQAKLALQNGAFT